MAITEMAMGLTLFPGRHHPASVDFETLSIEVYVGVEPIIGPE
jgi:hypothetical protein